MKEIWKPVFYGLYAVSSFGRVKRVVHYRPPRTPDGMLRVQKLSTGYNIIALCRGNRVCPKLVHRLVAQAFIGPIRGRVVNHLNGVKNDNRVKNLEIVTHRGNAQHASRTGLLSVGSRHYKAKLTEPEVLEIRATYRRGIGPVLAKRFGVHVSMIHYIIQRANWKHI